MAFLNTETLTNEQTGEKLFDSFATGAGFGFRLMLNKRSKTNLCFDIGWGKEGSRAVYFAVQEAFWRPSTRGAETSSPGTSRVPRVAALAVVLSLAAASRLLAQTRPLQVGANFQF